MGGAYPRPEGGVGEAAFLRGREIPMKDHTSTETALEGKSTGGARTLKVTVALIFLLLAVEAVSLGYLIYVLGLYTDNRWKILLAAEVILASMIIPINTVFCLRWARELIEFSKMTATPEGPSLEQSLSLIHI